MHGKHFIISGKVQGVFYRQSTKQKAEQLDLTGWVRNCDNGNVEAHAFGCEENLNLFEKWLWDGPQFAKVNQVVASKIPLEEYADFTVRR